MAEHPATERLWGAIDERRDELVQTVADLVRFPSVLGQEAGVQGYVAEHLRASGFATESWDLNDSVKQQPNAGESNVPFPGRPNVTGKRAGQGGGRSLIMNGHIDVVSAEPVSAWRYDPWAAQIVGDRMYGRGAYDMKSGVALNLFLSRLLNDLDIPLKGDFTIHSVIEEECTGNGALAASLRDRADACIVTEPHFGDYTRAHLGVMWFRVAIEGKSAHAGHAWQGVNAIVKAAPIVLALRDLDNRMPHASHHHVADAEVCRELARAPLRRTVRRLALDRPLQNPRLQGRRQRTGLLPSCRLNNPASRSATKRLLQRSIKLSVQSSLSRIAAHVRPASSNRISRARRASSARPD